MAAREIPSDIANDDTKLKAYASQEFGSEFNESSSEIDSWTYYYVDMIPAHEKDRIVVFKAPDESFHKPKGSPWFGCIRVLDKDDITKIVWDVVQREEMYIGLVPAGCDFEAMVVVIKLITPK
ncbi:hypothetical protein CC80DRAFT_596068 [Byssothecium circinans]|uniref:Uncharacterized protein n=1 Tax=Byssothecium circinans TaxID=147558 RepID=A0A6A5TLA9_9PLEO|nr:hypothetical protein CC80DRAFT_596068 [Byssothecium circinans]